MKRLTLLISLFTITIYTSSAQSYLTMGGHGAFPQNNLKKAEYDHGAGFHMAWMSKLRPITPSKVYNLQGGMFMDVSWLGHRNFSVMLNTPVPDVGKLTISNSSVSFYGVIRNSFDFDKYAIYADFVFGPRGYYTNQTIKAENPILNPDYEAVSRPEKSVVITGKMQKGIAAGCMYKMSKNVYADFGFTYALGPKGLVQPLKDVTQIDNEINYAPRKIETDILLIRAGFVFVLNPGTGSYSSSTQPSSDYQSVPERTRYNNSTTPRSSTTPSSSTPKKSLEVKPNNTPKKKIDY